MPRALVTGAAGFIGSHLAGGLLDAGWQVRGVDCCTDYYDVDLKRANLDLLRARTGFEFVASDLEVADLAPLVDDVAVVFHLAGQPGVRLSWSGGFPSYVGRNVVATHRLLEACQQARLERFVYASSSSVYGNAARYPTTETDLPSPHNPYGVTKLAGEHLCGMYASNYGLPTVALRYFTVYGPRQRPDMAFHRFIEAARRGDRIPLYGSGQQIRDFTYVSDVVDANIAAAAADVPPGSVFNVAGGGSTTVNAVLGMLGDSLGAPVRVEHLPEQRGDVAITGGATDAARVALGWQPRVALATGLGAQVAWHRDRDASASAQAS